MERDVAEERPGKRRRFQEESDTEDDSGYHSSHHSSSGNEDHLEEAMNMEERTTWTREDTITAEYIEGLQCHTITGRDIEVVEDEAGKGSWRL
eukprot:9936033-Heterocapsa_arctica.AAC.1